MLPHEAANHFGEILEMQKEIDRVRAINAELLAACKAVWTWINLPGIALDSNGELAQQVIAAIAHAEGQP